MKIQNVISVLIILIIGFALGYFYQSTSKSEPQVSSEIEEVATDVPEGWQEYNHPSGQFSFLYPEGRYVSAREDGTSVTLLPAPVEDGPVPDMTIKIHEGDISAGARIEFKAWENFDIPYFDELVSSFEFK